MKPMKTAINMYIWKVFIGLKPNCWGLVLFPPVIPLGISSSGTLMAVKQVLYFFRLLVVFIVIHYQTEGEGAKKG